MARTDRTNGTGSLKNTLNAAFFLFIKYISRGNKGTLVLTILVATLAFLEINIISGILSSAINQVYYQTKSSYVSNIVVQPGKDQWGNKEQYIKQASRLKDEINAIPGVVASSSRYTIAAVIEYDPDKTGKDIRAISWPVESINPVEEVKITNISRYMVAGEYLTETDRDMVIMGRETSGGYGAGLELQSLKGADIGNEVKIKFANGITRKYTIKGIFATAFPYADMSVFITEKEMESVLGIHDRASKILVKTDNANSEEYYISLLRQAGLETQDINPWISFIGLVLGLTQTFSMIKNILLLIGLMVAGVTIFIVIFIATTSKKKQIGIMRAVGMKEEILIISYMLLAFFYALMGIGLGIVVMEWVLKPYFSAYPLVFPIGKVGLSTIPAEIIMSVISLLIVSLIAGFIPSWRVTKENIIKAIWG